MIEVHGKGEYAIVPFPEDRKPIDIGDYYADYSKIRDALNWNPRLGLEQGSHQNASILLPIHS